MCIFYSFNFKISPSPPSLLTTSSSRSLLCSRIWKLTAQRGTTGTSYCCVRIQEQPYQKSHNIQGLSIRTIKMDTFKSVNTISLFWKIEVKIRPCTDVTSNDKFVQLSNIGFNFYHPVSQKRGMKLSSVWNFLNVWHPYRFKLQWSWRWVNNPWF